jgi:hypothetical protein
MFEMLPEVVRTEKLLRVITFTELMDGCEMLKPGVPIGLRIIRELFTAVTADIVRSGT